MDYRVDINLEGNDWEAVVTMYVEADAEADAEKVAFGLLSELEGAACQHTNTTPLPAES